MSCGWISVYDKIQKRVKMIVSKAIKWAVNSILVCQYRQSFVCVVCHGPSNNGSYLELGLHSNLFLYKKERQPVDKIGLRQNTCMEILKLVPATTFLNITIVKSLSVVITTVFITNIFFKCSINVIKLDVKQFTADLL